ncbi:hypothetical protein Tco_1146977 [Tanacetum coccineum]
MQLSSTRQSASTRHKGKEVAKPITPPSESVSEEDSDPEQAQRDKEMQKNLALLAKYFKKLYKLPLTKPISELLLNSRKDLKIPHQASDWLEDKDEDDFEQELEAPLQLNGKDSGRSK